MAQSTAGGKARQAPCSASSTMGYSAGYPTSLRRPAALPLLPGRPLPGRPLPGREAEPERGRSGARAPSQCAQIRASSPPSAARGATPPSSDAGTWAGSRARAFSSAAVIIGRRQRLGASTAPRVDP
eukprot:scaffold112171_cov45-Phaeocystis_antarctica.AAC.1